MNELVRLSAGAPASALLLAAIVVVSVLGLFAWPTLIERNLLRPHGLAQRGDYFTLISSGFIHADVAHLLLNGFTFWAFAFGLERRLGTPSFVALYGAGLLSSSVATWLIHRRQPGYASLGASGAILAVLFASIVAVPTVVDLHPALAGADPGAALRARLPRLQRVREPRPHRPRQSRRPRRRRHHGPRLHGGDGAGLAAARVRGLARLSEQARRANG